MNEQQERVVTEQEEDAHYRIAMLIQGRCPIHGAVMIRSHADSKEPQSLYCCPRVDCTVMVNETPSGALQLSSEYAYLLATTNSPQN